jgi:lactoylglutathione lyase
MRIGHIAIWTSDLERCRQFYVGYFGAVADESYSSAQKVLTPAS